MNKILVKSKTMSKKGKNMKKKILLPIIGLLSFAATAADPAHILEIKPWYSDGTQGYVTNYSYSAENPAQGGEKLWFVIRLLNNGWSTGTPPSTAWTYPTYSGTLFSKDSAAWVASAPKIGIVVSGRTVGATIEAIASDTILNMKPGTNSGYITDIVCSYTVQPGDFALPIRLAADGKGTPIDRTETMGGFTPFIINGNLWQWTFPGGTDEIVWEWAAPTGVLSTYTNVPEGGKRTTDYDLTGAGMFVKTVDFTNRGNEVSLPRWYAAGTCWRGVHENSPDAEPSFATLTLTGVSTKEVTLYVWSENDNVIKMGSGEGVTMKSKDGLSITNSIVYTVTFAAGETTKSLPLQAVGLEGAGTNLVLSEFKGFRTLDDGTPEEDYLTIPVAVIEKKKPSVKVQTTTDRFAVPADPDAWVTPVGSVTLTISGGYETVNDTLTVTLTPSIVDGTPGWSNYVHIASDGTSWTKDGPLVFTYNKSGPSTNDRKFANGEDITETVYVYGLGADRHTSVGGVRITPVLDDAAAASDYFQAPTALDIYLMPEDPVVSGVNAEADGNFKRRFDIQISDNHKNTIDDRGYTISYMVSNTVTGAVLTDFAPMDGKWKLDGNRMLVSVVDSTTKPEINYTPGRYVTVFRVATPEGDRYSTRVLTATDSVEVNVAEPARSSAVIVLDDGTTADTGKYDESDDTVIPVKVVLSAAYPAANVWAFLAPVAGSGTAERSAGNIVTNAATSIGMLIAQGELESELGGLQIVDGKGGTGSALSYDIVLCTESQFDPGKLIQNYQSRTLRITANNVAPAISDVMLNGIGTAEFDNHYFTQLIPVGRTNSIKPNITDVAADIKGNMVITLNARCETGDILTPMTITNTTETMTAEFKNVVFNTEGRWTVKVKATDKDGGASNEYSFSFTVKEPNIGIGNESNYFEDYFENDTGAVLPISLSFFDTATNQIVVKVTVKAPSGTNPGRFVLADTYRKDIEGYPALAENEYYVPFKTAKTENLRIVDMDGTDRSSDAGFEIKAEVVTEGLNTAYSNVSKVAYVRNVSPEFSDSVIPQNTETNAFPVGRELTLSVATKYEAKSDLTNQWTAVDLAGASVTTNGVRIAISGCVNADVFFIADAGSYKFRPEFDNSSYGVQTVMMTIEDKDGGSGEALVYYFEVPLSKALVTAANGPGSGTTSIPISSRYARQKGVGEGHVYVSDASFEKAENFALKWNCARSSTVTAYAFGYAFGYVDVTRDDGTLDVVDGKAYDIAINAYGNRAQGSGNPAEPYEYSDVRNRDSYFYGWIQSTEPGGNEYTIAVNPEVGNKRYATTRIDLPSEANKDGAGYAETYAEAVFSKEYKESDNMGDINEDGVPDYFAILDYANGRLAEPDGQGSELGAVNALNDDEDYLPGGSQITGANFIPGDTSGWSTRGAPFTARMEIRGFGGADESEGANSTVYGGLNYGMFKFGDELKHGWISDLDLTQNEKISLLKHVFARRDAILNRRYTQRPGVNKFDGGDWNVVTNVLATLISSDTSYYENGSDARKAYIPGFEDKVPSNADGSPKDPAIIIDGWNEGLGHKTFVIVTNVVNAVASQPELYPAVTNVTTNVCWVSESYATASLVPRAITNTVQIVTNIYTEGTTVKTNLFWRTPYDRITIADVNVNEWLDRKASESAFYESQAAARAYIDHIWGHYLNRDTSEWGWTCENRTDPTIDDTDGDGFSDGYEYYIWYSAVVGFNGNTLSGYKIDLSDRDSRGIPITSAEIASLYNPNVEGSIKRDTDEDGIADFEEMVIGTNPFHWDTDGDGLSDGYELTYNMDPLSASGEHGCDMNLDGDFMAFVDVADNNTREELAHLLKYKYIYTATNGTVWAFSTNVVDEIRYIAQRYPTQKVFELRNVTAFKVGKYGVTKYTDKEGVTKYYDDYYIPATEELDKLLAFLDPSATSYEFDSAWTNASTFAINPKAGSVTLRDEKRANDPEPPAVAMGLFHHQVHNAFGFDPRTGWYSSGNGLSKTARWKNGLNAVVPGGAAQNTTAFKARYEYTLPKYLSIVNSDMAWVPTNPGVPFETTSENEDGTIEHRMTQHGADTDADGVPDGWELYIGVDPGTAFTSDDETTYNRIRDIDKVDGLTLAYEFAGTDSCGVYSECASIYKNHPSQDTGTMKNWYNKFFPTNPRESDSDGDSISDGAEGKSWRGEFVINRIPQTEDGSVSINYFSIYGSPSDDGTTSIRGGGYNPCTIDTDSDGLPDPWERQFTGVLFNGTEISDSEDYDVFYASAAGQIDERVRKDIKAALVAYDIPTNVLAGAEFYHILMGMDGTVADASTSTLLGASDLDWDGDGLQNWQEYMVQAMRLFRYDDDKTPLLGLDCPSVAADGEKQGKWNVDNGFLQISYTEPFTDVQLEFIDEELGYHNFAVWAQRTENYMKDLGYFIDPPMAWDHARNTLKQKYMLPPANIRYYTFAKGSSQATDGNGNAIYTYELAGKQYEFTNNVSGVVNSSGNALVGGRLRKLTAKMVDNSALAMDAYTVSPGKYFSTDPRRWDTDADGMDDYYELFHGLNPILGEVAREAGMNGKYVRGKDVIATATAGKVSPGNNAWIGWSNEEAPVYDPIRYPWLMGAGECDADSDGLRNSEESLLANATSPNAMHTDPTPLWMTDVSVKTRTSKIFRTTTTPVMEDDGYGNQVQLWDYNSETGEEYPVYETITVNTDQTVKFVDTPSYAALFYRNELKGTGVNNVSEMSALPYGGWHLSSSDYAFSFEQNEGYDTDNDWRSDSAELQNSAEPTSDPLDFADPQRRQSVWFGGPEDQGMLVSREESKRSTGGVDLFKQFTVEAWVRPENPVSGKEQYIVSRAVYCNASSVINTNAQVRLDFALGINTNGCAFGELMNSVDAEYRKIGTEIPQDEWTHLAATFDGYNFSLYMNGELVDSGVTTLISANGTTAILQNPHFSRMEGGAYSQDPSIMAVGARPVGETIFNVANVSSATGWSDIATDFFKGSVDEVRCWDGARTADEIKADYRTRYTPERAKENRIAVYNAYVNGASRNDTAGRSTLPPELIHHYDFSTLAGANDADYVQKVPAGFGSRLLASVCCPTNGMPVDSSLVKVGWWSRVVGNANIGSKVYVSTNVVPWVEDTVAHLPKLCGSVADSVFWSENFAGYVPAEDNGLSTYLFPNTMNPYTVVEDLNEYSYLRSKLAKVSNTTNETANAYPELSLMTEGTIFGRFYYDNRRGFSGNSDLIPLGSAFAKRLAEYWDGIGPEDAWAITSSAGEDDGDPDDTGIPEWARLNGFDTYAKYKSALYDGLLPTNADDYTGSPYKTFAGSAEFADTNGNNIPDWWEIFFGIMGCDPNEDLDNDGLSTYQEYFISFGDWSVCSTQPITLGDRQQKNIGMPFLDPTDAYSTGDAVIDYFLKPDFTLVVDPSIVKDSYLGEIVADHDFIEDGLETQYSTVAPDGKLYANRYVWDALRDADGDGWGNWSEVRAGTRPNSVSALDVDGNTDADYPQPVVALTVSYNGSDRFDAPIMVQAWSEKYAAGQPDAAWQIGESAAEGEASASDGDAEGSVTMNTRYLGFNTGDVRTFYIGPGKVVPGTVSVKFKDPEWMLYHYSYGSDGTRTFYGGERHSLRDATWQGNVRDKADKNDPSMGKIYYSGTVTDDPADSNVVERVVGSINYSTGEVTLDFSVLNNTIYFVGSISSAATVSSDNVVSIVNMSESYVQIAWSSGKTEIGTHSTYYLGAPNATAKVPSLGRLREGAATFIVFSDSNGDGAYTEGEPLGVAKHVMVGWDKVSDLVVELSETSRSADRFVVDAITNGVAKTRIKVMRTAVNGVSVMPRVVYARTLDFTSARLFTEADFMAEGDFDFDWKRLVSDAETLAEIPAADIRTVEYKVYLGSDEGPVHAFTRTFAAVNAAPFATATYAGGDYLVRSARPTLQWSGSDGGTAFALQIAKDEAFGEVVYATTNFMPAATEGGYAFKPEAYVGEALEDGSNYWWRVASLNAKFREPLWSEPAEFKTAVNSDSVDTGYGRLGVEVRYFGPSDADLANVVVGVYESADFAGAPVARLRLAGDGKTTSLTNDLSRAFEEVSPNATFDGIAPGRYYVMAWIDVNTNGVRDAWESWGYVNKVATGASDLWTPVATEVVSTKAALPTALLVMEDTDANQNAIPDCLDDQGVWATFGRTADELLDTDGDGLPDVDEDGAYGTDPYMWDTDGDGMPDGWELLFGRTDPLTADADYAADGDVMAYAVTNLTVITTWDGVDPYSATNVYVVVDEDASVRAGDDAGAIVNLCAVYDYGGKYALGKPTSASGRVYAVDGNAEVVLVHGLVYDFFGFNPATANPAAVTFDGSNYVYGVNTKPFTALDKYLVVRYLESLDLVDEVDMNTNRLWAAYTLKPGDVDNDKDGVADGWELYVGASPWEFADRDSDGDGDGLPLVDEFNSGNEPFDPGNQYSVYENFLAAKLLLPGTAQFSDAEARRFSVSEADVNNDDDNDQLTNLQEIQAYYYDKAALADIDPAMAWSDGATPDYFRAAGSTYLGLLFNGGEFIEPAVRSDLGLDNTFGLGTRDMFQSGWDVWSIVRYSANKSATIDEHTAYVNYFSKYLSIRYGDAYSGTTEEDAIKFHNEKKKHDHSEIEECVACVGGLEYIKEYIKQHQTSTLDNSDCEIPAPKINLLLRYAGNATQPLVVEAYQINSAYPEYGEQMTARWSQDVLFDSGVSRTELEVPGRGSVKQGLTRFVAYFDIDGIEGLSAGDTSGSATAEVGYLGCDLTIALGEANPALPAISLSDGTNVVSTLALVRSAINGKPLYNSAKGVFIVQFPNNAAREALYPDEYDTGSYIGVDPTLYMLDNIDEVESVTYEVLRLQADEVSGLSVSNLNNYVVIRRIETDGEISVVSNMVSQVRNETVTFRYSLERDVAESIACSGSTADDFTFTFTVPTDTANTKFWLNVQADGAANATLIGGTKGFILSDIRDGVVVLDKYWFEANQVTIPTGLVRFGVILGNDKFGKPAEPASCKMAEVFINEGTSYEGRLSVKVEHPMAALGAKLTVAAYEKADLVNPVAVKSGCAAGQTVEIEGLRPDASYYVAAWYVNDADDGRGSEKRRMPYDTWGYLCNINVTNATQIARNMVFDPVAVAAVVMPVETNTIWLQDTDWNDNGIVDREEDFRSIDGVYSRSVDPVYGFDVAGAEETEIFSDVKEDDAFAYAEVPFYCVMAEVDGVQKWFAVTDLAAETLSDKVTPGIPVGASLKDLVSLKTTYLYDYGKSNAKRLALGTNVVYSGEAKVIKVVEDKALILVHGQVYDHFSFDQNTANGRIDRSAWVNTRAFTSADKVFVTNYLANVLGVADAWQYDLPIEYPDADVVADGHGDGVLDGWELYVKHSPWDYNDRTSDVDGDGLDLLHEYDGGVEPTDPWNGDSDGDGIGDKASRDYMFKYGGDGAGKSGYRGDADNDQLSNFMEYLISGLDGFPEIDPEADLDASAMSTFAKDKKQLVPDYFLPHGKLYLGEIFTDHDMIEDWWEDEQPVEVNVGGARVANYSRYSFDAAYDTDGDGWSNWAEARMAIARGKVAVTTVTTNTVGGVTTVETNTVEKYVYDQNGAITPTIQAVFRYNGDKTGVSSTDTLVVKAWTTARATLGECDAAWVVPVGNLATDGSISVTLEKPTYGTLREGSNMFEAYIVDGTVESVTDYTVGKPYGVATDVTVNYLRGEPFTLELTNIDPTTMRVDLSKALAIQREYAATLATRDSEWWTRYNSGNSEAKSWYNTQIAEAFNRMATESTDRRTVRAGYATLYCPKYCGTNLTFAVSNTVHVWFTQMLINGQIPARYYKTEIFDKEMDLGRRSILTEADLLASGEYDLGWNTLPDSVGPISMLSVTSAVFGVVIDAAPSNYLAENNLLLVEIENHYEEGDAQSPAKCLSATVTAGQPTFEWRHDNTILKPYPAFRLKVWAKEGNKLVYDSYVQRAPARNANGVYRWTAPLWVGSMTTQGQVFDADKDYIWSVSMLDAKFQDPLPANGICKGEFHVADVADAAGLSDYGTIAVAVKYMGPGSVKVSGKTGIIRVEAYEQPDFSGMPVAASYVLNKDTLASIDKIAMNALLRGLPKGNAYYVLAYLDSNGDGKRQAWESWGYGCYVGDPERRDVYTPRAYGVALTPADDLNTPTCVIYLEDCDTNNNKLPDVLELKDNNFSPSSSPSAESPYIVTVSATGERGALNVFSAVEPDVVSLPYYSTLVEMENGGLISSPSLALAMSGISVASLNVEPKVTILSFTSTEGVVIEVDPRAVVDGSTLVTSAVSVDVKLKFTFEWTPNLATAWTELPQTTGTISLTEKRTFAANDPVLAPVNEKIKKISADYPTAFFRLKSVEVVNN